MSGSPKAPDFPAAPANSLTTTQDDGQPIASLRLTPDGKTALYAVGTELNDAQESANPESWTKGAKQQVFAIDVDAKERRAPFTGRNGMSPRKAAKISRSLPMASRPSGPPKRSCGSPALTASSRPKNWPRFAATRFPPSGPPMASTSRLSASAALTASSPSANLAATLFATSRPASIKIPCRAGLRMASRSSLSGRRDKNPNSL